MSISKKNIVIGGLVGLVILSGMWLSSSFTVADDSIDANVSLSIPMACTMTGTIDTPHTATVDAGTYRTDIGTTTLKTVCNDGAGFSIYAIGYSNQEYGNNKLLATVGGTLSPSNDIATGTATSGSTSNWAMKLKAGTGSYQSTIVNGYDNYSNVPTVYTKVATRLASTDLTTGSNLQTTYAAYVTSSQSTGTYNGKVKYTLVHPNNHAAPVSHPAVLDTGKVVNSKLKSLAATVVNGEETTITPEFDPDGGDDWNNAYDEYIKSIDVHLETATPSGFTPSEKNTISVSNSDKPIYIDFENTNNAGIMHFYTEGEQIILPTDSSYMFYLFSQLADLSDISDWDAANVVDMSYMFYYTDDGSTSAFALDLSSWDVSKVTNMASMFVYAGSSATTWSIGDLSSWNTSSVTDMYYMLYYAGSSATTWSIGDLSSWDTSSVTNMSYMFSGAGYSATTFTLNLSSWNTSSVTNMTNMFTYAGYSATTWSIGDLSSWNTSNVTNMSNMFSNVGTNATTWSVGNLSSWNTSSVTNMSYMFYYAGRNATTWSIGDLSSWNTSKVTNMSYTFSYAGYKATTWSIGDLSSWNTSSITNMDRMFSNAGFSATTFTLNLSSWNTSKVTYMSFMFSNAGYNATTFTLNLSSWNTSSVTSMNSMFTGAGNSATTWSVTVPKTNGNGINNTTSRLYGKTTSTYVAPDTGKTFTLAQ